MNYIVPRETDTFCMHCGAKIRLWEDTPDDWVSVRGIVATSYCNQENLQQLHEPLLPIEMVIAELQMVEADLR